MILTLHSALDDDALLRPLFRQYSDYLIACDEGMADCLRGESYDEELSYLHERYRGGDIYLARVDGAVAGCVALRRMDETRCEMKRVFLTAPFRGRGLGRALVGQALARAKEMGCRYVCLDTAPYLTAAVAVYEALGFTPRSRFDDNPLRCAVYYEKEL